MQSKTSKEINLPLLPDVGWTIIDYLKNGRPKVQSPFVFLRHLAPLEPFSDEEHLYQVVVKYMRLTKIPITPSKKKDMPSLRHTLVNITNYMEVLPQLAVIVHQRLMNKLCFQQTSSASSIHNPFDHLNLVIGTLTNPLLKSLVTAFSTVSISCCNPFAKATSLGMDETRQLSMNRYRRDGFLRINISRNSKYASSTLAQPDIFQKDIYGGFLLIRFHSISTEIHPFV